VEVLAVLNLIWRAIVWLLDKLLGDWP